jgi:UDP-glucose 4-epimerase
MARILITGGAGFVGSHLAERLVAEGHHVTSLDNYFTGSLENHVKGVIYIQDCTTNLTPDFSEEGYDIVYHLGEYSRVEQSFEDIELVHKFNIQGTTRVLECVRAWNAKLVYSGSSTKFADRDDKDYVMSPYAWSKAKNTELVKMYAEWFGIDYAITYFYNVYGPREIQDGKYATLIAKYARLMEEKQLLPVVSPGTQQRNFTHVDDIVDALVLIGEKGQGDEYGIGHPERFTVLDVATLFGGQIEKLPPRKGNRMAADVITDNTRALGWEPKRNLRDYINRLVDNG